MNNLFLKVDGIDSEEQAVTWSINAALQRNKVYKNDEDYERREKFRAAWANLIRAESKAYRKPTQPISDNEHCAAIAGISDELSCQFGAYLIGGRLRFGTSQKAFNLYLKYLWAMGEAEMPPHCPIDSVVLNRVGINASWTKSDSCEEYMGWINEIRKRLTLAEWENEVWLRWRLINSGL
jgi:hypothetical protein